MQSTVGTGFLKAVTTRPLYPRSLQLSLLTTSAPSPGWAFVGRVCYDGAMLRLAMALMLFGACRVHVFLDGEYVFSGTEVLLDECAMGPGAASLLDGRMDSSGHLVSQFSTTLGELRGFYLGGTERLRLDGLAAELPLTLRGQSCTVESLVVVVTLDGDQWPFSGTLSLEAKTPRQPACSCRTWLNISASPRSPST